MQGFLRLHNAKTAHASHQHNQLTEQGMMELEIINKLFLELSQVATAKTEKEIMLERLVLGSVKAQTIDALKSAYRKHATGDDSIGWDELRDILCDAICNEIGDKAFQQFLSEQPK